MALNADWPSHVLHGEKLAMRVDDLMMSHEGLDDEDDEDDDEAHMAAGGKWEGGPGSPGGLGTSWDGGWEAQAY
jgi:hypothetical protein